MLCPYKRKDNLKKITRLVSESITEELRIRQDWLKTLPGFSPVLNKAYQDIVKTAIFYIVPDAKNITMDISCGKNVYGTIFFDYGEQKNIAVDFEKPLHTRQLQIHLEPKFYSNKLQTTKEYYEDYMEYYG